MVTTAAFRARMCMPGKRRRSASRNPSTRVPRTISVADGRAEAQGQAIHRVGGMKVALSKSQRSAFAKVRRADKPAVRLSAVSVRNAVYSAALDEAGTRISRAISGTSAQTGADLLLGFGSGTDRCGCPDRSIYKTQPGLYPIWQQSARRDSRVAHFRDDPLGAVEF